MSKLKFENRGIKAFLMSNGFFAALILCFGALCVVAFITATNLGKIVDEPLPGTTENAGVVGNTVTNVPDTAAAATQATTNMQTTVSSTSPQSTVPSTVSDNQTAVATFFAMPVSGNIFKPFSDGELVYSKTFGDYRIHSGIDIEAKKGDKVKASGEGRVTRIYKDAMYGNVVEIDHGGGITGFYAGLNDKPTVKEGDIVDSTIVIGSIDTIPCEELDTPHLHFALSKNGEFIDPVGIMGLTD